MCQKVYSLYSAFCTLPVFYSQSAVCILPLVHSLQSAVCVLHWPNSVNINFTLNLTQGVFINRIYRISHPETWNFKAPTLVTSVPHKITAKCGILCPKTLLLTEKQLHTTHFFVATGNVCPLAIPEPFAPNMGLQQSRSQRPRSFWSATGIGTSVWPAGKSKKDWHSAH